MSVQFVVGTGRMDHEEELVKQAETWLKSSPTHEVFYLVPNSIKFEKEVQLLKRLGKLEQENESREIASTRMQVFSFYRLAWYFLQNTPYLSSENINKAGMAMIFRKILRENRSLLSIFKGEVNKTGFIAQLVDLFNEFHDGNISNQDLEKVIASFAPEDRKTSAKFQDIYVLFEKYQEALAHYQWDSSDSLDYLIRFLETIEMQNTMIIIDGYSRFSAREYKLLDVLMRKSGEFRLALVTDKITSNEALNPMDLFYDSKKVYQTVLQMARRNGLPLLLDVHVTRERILREDFVHLDEYWREEKSSQNNGQDIQLWKADNPFIEIHRVAKEIHRLVVEEGYRYKDIEVLTRDLDSYHQHIAPIFAWNDIPIYSNHDEEMNQHPLIELFHSIFSIHDYYFRYADVLRLLRSELFVPDFQSENEQVAVGESLDLFVEPESLSLHAWQQKMREFRDSVDITENIVLKYGYEHGDWTKEKDWSFITYDFTELNSNKEEKHIKEEKISNEIRHFVGQTLSNFYKEMDNSQTGKNAAKIFYKFLVDQRVEQQMLYFRDQAIDRGELDEARRYEQTWEEFIALLDEYVLIFGEEPLNWEEFTEIFSSGFDNLSYGKVPAMIDRVQITSLELARAGQAKVVFVIGLTNQVLPMTYENKSILSEEERTYLVNSLDEGQFLLNDAQASTAKEPFMAYLLFLSATDKLYLSYPATSEESKDLLISPYLERLSRGLNLAIQEMHTAQLTDNGEQTLAQVSTYRMLLSDLVLIKEQQKVQELPLSIVWEYMEKQLNKSALSNLSKKVNQSLTKKNLPTNLDKEAVEKLYSKELYASVSQFELFHSCGYKYFAQYGLRLKEREKLELDSATTGNFFHEALDTFFKMLLMAEKDLAQLTQTELEKFAESVLYETLGEQKFDILNRNNRMRYLKHQLADVVKRCIWALKKQADRTGLKTSQTEVLFGQLAGQVGINGLEFELSDGAKLHIRGKIDRVDQMNVDNQEYLAVIDYKSSAKDFDIVDSYYGIAMQMITYLDVALTDANEHLATQPVGSFYFHLENPELKYDSKYLTYSQEDDALLEEFKLKGFVVNNQEMLEKLDLSEQRSRSGKQVFEIKEGKNGIQQSATYPNKFFKEDELQTLIDFNQYNFKQAGEEILSGEIRLNPLAKGKDPIACKYCPFRSICAFDPMLKENNYERIQTFGESGGKGKKEAVLSQMKEELEEIGGEEENE
ncbi:MAG: PD-(D/E)XK nuclease family protein [Lactobacillales bacterium]|nr:PD-(D/E)XK nuclease family protein [Lactobacillales bacterium]